jgi:ornithine cyclodeaminase
MQIIDAATNERRLPFPALIGALRQMFADGCTVPQRHVHPLAAGDGSVAGTLLLMPAWRPGRYLGIKTVAVFPGNAARGKPGLHSVYLLLDARSGEPLALIDGDQITSRRTAAASAASYLARPDASRLLVVGAGRVASLMPEAMRAVRPIAEVAVWARRPEAAKALAASLQVEGFAAQVCTDLPTGVARADIVSCSTMATEPLIQGRWLQAGTHLDLIGGFTPQMREADGDCFARCRVFVDTLEATQKSGDWLQALAEGDIAPADLRGTLADLCPSDEPGRASERELTLFKSVGTALEDLAAAELVLAGD